MPITASSLMFYRSLVVVDKVAGNVNVTLWR